MCAGQGHYQGGVTPTLLRKTTVCPQKIALLESLEDKSK